MVEIIRKGRVTIRRKKVGQSAKDIAKRALKKANSIQRKFEKKYFIASYNGTGSPLNITPNATSPYWDQFCMNQIAGGSGDGQRVGNRISLRKLFIDMLFQMSGNVDGGQAVRVVIVQDKQTSPDSAITLSTLFNNTSSNFNTLLALNAGAQYRYHVLHDKVYMLDPVNLSTTQSGGTTNGTDMLNTQKHVRLSFGKRLLKEVVFNGTGSGDFDDNSIYFLITKLNTDSNGSIVAPSIRWYLEYTDN